MAPKIEIDNQIIDDIVEWMRKNNQPLGIEDITRKYIEMLREEVFLKVAHRQVEGE